MYPIFLPPAFRPPGFAKKLPASQRSYAVTNRRGKPSLYAFSSGFPASQLPSIPAFQLPSLLAS